MTEGGVQRVRVGDVLQLIRRPVSIDPIQVYTQIGVRSFGKGIFHYDPVTGAELGKLRFFEVHPDELVVSNIKGWEGAIAVSSEEDDGCIGSNRFLTYQSRDERADIRYLKYFFLSEPGLELIRRASPGSTDRNLTLGIKAFESIEMPLPSMDRQEKVARWIDSVLASKSRVSVLAGRAAEIQAAYVSALVQRPELTNDQRYDRGWQYVPLGTALSVANDTVKVKPDHAYDITGVYSFGRGLFARGTLQGSETSYKHLHRLTAGSLVMSRLKAWEGALAVVPERFHGSHVSPEFPTFSINRDAALPAYINALVTSLDFWQSLARDSKGLGARRERISAARLLEQKIWLPPLAYQQRFADLVRSRSALTEHVNHRSAALAALEPALLNHAFAGIT